jgi:hypothetical protein
VVGVFPANSAVIPHPVKIQHASPTHHSSGENKRKTLMTNVLQQPKSISRAFSIDNTEIFRYSFRTMNNFALLIIAILIAIFVPIHLLLTAALVIVIFIGLKNL